METQIENDFSKLNETKIAEETKNHLLYKSWKQQIEHEQVRFYLIFFFIGGLFLTSLGFTILWILKLTNAINIVDFTFDFFFLQKWFVFPICAFFFIVLVKNYLDWYRFQKEKEIHFNEENAYNFSRTPNFVIEMYKRNHARVIFIRWWLVASIIMCGIIFGFLTIAKITQNVKELKIQGIVLTFKNINSEKTYLSEFVFTGIYLSIVVLVNLWVWINSNREISNLLASFDIKNIYPDSELNSYKKRIHIISFCLFLLPFFIILILILLIKKLWRRK